MRVLVFATEETPDGPGVSPFVVIPDSAGAYLPQHPFGREWRYFATVPLGDALLRPEHTRIAAGLENDGYYVSYRPLRTSQAG